MPPGWSEIVHGFWFTEVGRTRWFVKDEALDRTIRERFEPLLGSVSAVPAAELAATARTGLAAVLVLDQFPRNMFRGSARMFAYDAQALALSRELLDRGHDRALEVDERLFVYLPFEHSERLADQERAVALVEALGDPGYLRFAEAHRDIVRRFGRFPHRNDVLGRPSTAEETAFLASPGSSF
jgi:uncharacterized protein (DUF924 family)